METESTKYVELLFDDVKDVNAIARESVVRSLLTFRQQRVFSGGMVVLWKGQRVFPNEDDRLMQLKKHYERLTMSVAQDFLLYGFSILLAPSVSKRGGEDVQVTSHVDMQAVIVRIQPRTASGFFSASNLDYLVLDRLKARPLKNCIVLEHPLWKPHSSGNLNSPVGSLLSWWRQKQKELRRADMVAETLSRVNIFYEDMPELYKLVDEESKSEDYEASSHFQNVRLRGTLPVSAQTVRGKARGPMTRNLEKERTSSKSTVPGITKLLGNLSQGNSIKLHELRQREAVYGGLLAENMEPIHKRILHEHVIPVNTYRAPRGTRIQRIQMPCDVKAQNRSSSSSSAVKRGDVMNSAFLEIKEKMENVFAEKAMRALEVGRGELGAWVFTGKKGFVRTILQDAVASVIRGDAVAWRGFEKVLEEQEEAGAVAGGGFRLKEEIVHDSQQKEEEEEEEAAAALVGKEEEPENEASKDPADGKVEAPPYLSEQQTEEAEKTARELAGISGSEWSLIFYELLVEKQRVVIKDIYVRDEAYKHGRISLKEDERAEAGKTNTSKKRPAGNSGKRAQKLPSNTIVDPNDPNYLIVGPYRRRVKH